MLKQRSQGSSHPKDMTKAKVTLLLVFTPKPLKPGFPSLRLKCLAYQSSHHLWPEQQMLSPTSLLSKGKITFLSLVMLYSL